MKQERLSLENALKLDLVTPDGFRMPYMEGFIMTEAEKDQLIKNHPGPGHLEWRQ